MPGFGPIASYPIVAPDISPSGFAGTGQIPTATRYRMGYRVSHVVRMLLAMIGW